MTYGYGKQFDIEGCEIDANSPPINPELYRTHAQGGLLFTPLAEGQYIQISVFEVAALFRSDDLKKLAAYIETLSDRMSGK